MALAKKAQVPCTVLGTVGGKRLVIRPWIDLPLEAVNHVWRFALALHNG